MVRVYTMHYMPVSEVTDRDEYPHLTALLAPTHSKRPTKAKAYTGFHTSDVLLTIIIFGLAVMDGVLGGARLIDPTGYQVVVNGVNRSMVDSTAVRLTRVGGWAVLEGCATGLLLVTYRIARFRTGNRFNGANFQVRMHTCTCYLS